MNAPAGRLEAYAADSSLKGKLRRRWSRLVERRTARFKLEAPIVSFSFDDIPATAAEAGAALLDAAGVKGTFYVCAGLCGRSGPMGVFASEPQIQALAQAGHEIGCHTFGHLDCGQADPNQIAGEAEVNAAALASLGLPRARTFAYPYGDVSPAAKRALSSRFRALRGLHAGLVEDGADLNQTPAVGIEGPDGEATARAWLQRAVMRKAWLILYTHDVQPEPSAWGCTPEALARLVADAQAFGCEIRTVDDALNRIGAAA